MVATIDETTVSLTAAFDKSAAATPDASLIVQSASRGGSHRLVEIVRRGRVFGSHLRARGVIAGDVVAIQTPAWSEWLVACVGVAYCGAVLLPIVSIYGAKEVGFILRQSRAKFWITPDRWRNVDFASVLAEIGELPGFAGHIVIGKTPPGAICWHALEQPIDVGTATARTPDDMALLVYTSGTTASPKGVCHSSRTLLSEQLAIGIAQPDLRNSYALSPWPPGHVAGAGVMLRYLAHGVPLVIMDQWEAKEAAMLIEKYRVASASFTPFHLSGLLDAADAADRDLSSLVSCLVGAAPVPPSLIKRCDERQINTFRCYGSSEHPTVTTGSLMKQITHRIDKYHPAPFPFKGLRQPLWPKC